MQSPAIMQTVTGSRRADAAIMAMIALAMIALAGRLGVYYRATVIDVTIERVDPDGTVTSFPTPDKFKQLGSGNWPVDEIRRRLRPMVNDHMRESTFAENAPPGSRFVWTVRYSQNHTRLDQELQLIWEPPHD